MTNIWKRAALAALPITLLLAGCSQQPAPVTPAAKAVAASQSTFSGDATVPDSVTPGLKVGLVTRITTGSWYEAYSRAVTAEVEALGGTVQVYDSTNDLSKMASNVDTAVNSGVDILLINNGTAEALDAPVQGALDAGIPVVTYDSDIALPDVSAINQDDEALASHGLEAIATDYDNAANIVVLSVAGYAPLDRRLDAVNAFVAENPDISIVAQAGAVSGNSSLETQAQVEALLKQYPNEGAIDAVWSHWNEFTRGAFEALKQADRSDVAVYSVDLTDQELPYFWDDTVDFQAASATNPATIGTSQVRLAYQKVAGEKVTDLSVEPVLVHKADLPDTEIAFDELAEYVPAWSADATVWPAWIQTLETAAK